MHKYISVNYVSTDKNSDVKVHDGEFYNDNNFMIGGGCAYSAGDRQLR